MSTKQAHPMTRGVPMRMAQGGVVSPYSLRGLANAAASVANGVVKPFSKPEGYTPATAAPAPAPAAAPARQLGGVNMDAIKRREEAAGMKDGGVVKAPAKPHVETPEEKAYIDRNMNADLAAHEDRQRADPNYRSPLLNDIPNAGAGRGFVNPPMARGVKGYSKGGTIKGKGGPTEDNIPIMASKGEYMVKAKAVKKLGVPFMHKLNAIADGEGDKKPGKPKARGVRKMFRGGLVDEIPKDGYPTAPAPDGKVSPSETVRNVNNSLNALGGMGVVASVPLRTAAAVPALTRELPQIAGPATGSMVTTGGQLATYAQQLPAAIPGLMEGARANLYASGVRAAGNASSAATGADTGQANPVTGAPTAPAMVASAPAAAPTIAPVTPAAQPAAAAPADGSMSYGQQMKNVGGAIVDGASTVMKTIVGAPGYGINANAAPAVPSANPAAPSNPTDARLAAAAQKPAVAVAAPAPAAPAAEPPLGTVQRIDGGSSPLLTNQPVADNASLMSRGVPSRQNQGAMDGIQARQDLADAGRASKAQFDQEVKDAAATNMAGGFGTGKQEDPRTMLLARLSGKKLNARGAKLLADMTATDATTAATAATTKLANDKFGVDKAGAVLDQQGKQRLLDAQAAFTNATTPEARVKAEENLRAVQAKYEKEAPNRYTVVPGGQEVVDGQVVRTPSQVLDNQTGKMVDQAAAAPKKATFETGKVYKDAKGNSAKWDGTKFVPV